MSNAQNTQGTGAGSAEPYNKGTDRTSMGKEKLLGPHCVTAGVISPVANAATVTFPYALAKSKVNYSVQLTPFLTGPGVTNGDVAINTLTDTNSQFTSFVIGCGTGVTSVHWAVFLNGQLH